MLYRGRTSSGAGSGVLVGGTGDMVNVGWSVLVGSMRVGVGVTSMISPGVGE